jgi:membrane protein
MRVKREIADDNLSIISAGVAFYAFLSIFPALAALTSIYGLVMEPTGLENHLRSIQGVLPPEAAQVFNNEVRRIGESENSRLGWSLAVGILLALWSAAKGMKAMIESMNVVYDDTESRGFLKLNAVAILLTLGAILFVILCLGLIVAIPVFLGAVGMKGLLGPLVNYVRWPVLALGGVFALGVLYRYAPSRRKPEWKWLTWGAAIAVLIWLSGSVLFSYYVTHFGSYNKTYGTLGVVVILMMWLLLSAFSVLLGAEINAEIEHQAAEDTTMGEANPKGQRGAYVADTLGRES